MISHGLMGQGKLPDTRAFSYDFQETSNSRHRSVVQRVKKSEHTGHAYEGELQQIMLATRWSCIAGLLLITSLASPPSCRSISLCQGVWCTEHHLQPSGHPVKVPIRLHCDRRGRRVQLCCKRCREAPHRVHGRGRVHLQGTLRQATAAGVRR